ncbi:unnamed protein product [Sphagnum jensenii]|uniref:Uncharacterized protein n=1 Tax=Sphagnum jensenii TaxID=128206 RepID=A0ABP0VQK2_9BRYO
MQLVSCNLHMEIGFFMPSCHHCLRVDPSTNLGLQGPVLQAAATATSAGLLFFQCSFC